jgi:hypothetical protein
MYDECSHKRMCEMQCRAELRRRYSADSPLSLLFVSALFPLLLLAAIPCACGTRRMDRCCGRAQIGQHSAFSLDSAID